MILLTTAPQLTFGHSGRTDSQGGHYNRRTGEYHFHHGMHAHQHPNGICPYSAGTNQPSKKDGSSSQDNIFTIFIAIASGFGLYHFMKNKNNKKYSNSLHKVLLKDSMQKKSEIFNHKDKVKNIACPSCKRGILILRNGKYGPFLGCSRFPSCRYTRNINYR